MLQAILEVINSRVQSFVYRLLIDSSHDTSWAVNSKLYTIYIMNSYNPMINDLSVLTCTALSYIHLTDLPSKFRSNVYLFYQVCIILEQARSLVKFRLI